MDWLKTLPIAYEGLLKRVRIVNFSVDKSEIALRIPKAIPLLIEKDKAYISMADLQIRHMRPQGFPKAMSLNYRHVAFRVLVDDRAFHEGDAQGAYFLQSFCDKACLVCGGSLFTDYQLCQASIKGERHFRLHKGKYYLKCDFGEHDGPAQLIDLKRTARLNKGYAVHSGKLWQTRIKPLEWPLECIDCGAFKTNFFDSAQLVGAYQVNGSLKFKRGAPAIARVAQRREHLQPVRVKYSPL